MKVSRHSPLPSAAGPRRSGPAGTGFRVQDAETGTDVAANSAAALNSVDTLAALIALQGTEGEPHKQSHHDGALRLSHDALDLLSTIQRDMLTGSFDAASLQKLIQTIGQMDATQDTMGDTKGETKGGTIGGTRQDTRQSTAGAVPDEMDDALSDIQAQILLRARVELAKRGLG